MAQRLTRCFYAALPGKLVYASPPCEPSTNEIAAVDNALEASRHYNCLLFADRPNAVRTISILIEINEPMALSFGER